MKTFILLTCFAACIASSLSASIASKGAIHPKLGRNDVRYNDIPFLKGFPDISLGGDFAQLDTTNVTAMEEFMTAKIQATFQTLSERDPSDEVDYLEVAKKVTEIYLTTTSITSRAVTMATLDKPLAGISIGAAVSQWVTFVTTVYGYALGAIATAPEAFDIFMGAGYSYLCRYTVLNVPTFNEDAFAKLSDSVREKISELTYNGSEVTLNQLGEELTNLLYREEP